MVNELIRLRKSVFPEHFIEKQIDKEIISEILTNAHTAPTHRITEPWNFRVFQSEESKKRLQHFLQTEYKGANTNDSFNQQKFDKIGRKIMASGAVIMISMLESGRVPQWEEIAATAMAVQNIYLSLDQYNLGGYWSSPKSIEHAGKYFPLKENELCMGFFYLGYYRPFNRSVQRSGLDEHVEWM